MQLTIPLLVFLSFSCASNTPSSYAGIDCNHKKFLCYNREQFYPCIAIGDTKTVTLSELQYCPEGLICDDSSEVECEEPKIVEVISLWRTLSPSTTNAVNGKTSTIETTSVTTLGKGIEIFTLNTTHDSTVTKISPTTSVFETSTGNNLDDHFIDIGLNLIKSNNSNIIKLNETVSDKFNGDLEKNCTKNDEIIDKYTRYTSLENSSLSVSKNTVQNQSSVTTIGKGTNDYNGTTEEIKTRYFQTSTISGLKSDMLNTNSNLNVEETITGSTKVNKFGSTSIISFKDETESKISTTIKTTEDKGNYNSYKENNEKYSADNNGSTTSSTISVIHTTSGAFDLEVNGHISDLVYKQDSQKNVSKPGSTSNIQSTDFNFKNEEDIINGTINNNNNNITATGSNISNTDTSSTLDFKEGDIRNNDVLNTTLSNIAQTTNTNDSSYHIENYKIINEQIETNNASTFTDITLPILITHGTGTTTNSYYYEDDDVSIVTDNVLFNSNNDVNNFTKVSISSTQPTVLNINLDDDKNNVRTTNKIEIDSNIENNNERENSDVNKLVSTDYVGTINENEGHDIHAIINNNEVNSNFNSTSLQLVRSTTSKTSTNFDFNKNVTGTTPILKEITNSHKDKYEEEISNISVIPNYVELTTIESSTSFDFDKNYSGTSSENVVDDMKNSENNYGESIHIGTTSTSVKFSAGNISSNFGFKKRGDSTVNEVLIFDINSNINHYNGGVSNITSAILSNLNVTIINTGTTDVLDFTSTTLSNSKLVSNTGSSNFNFDNIVANTADDENIHNIKTNEDDYNENFSTTDKVYFNSMNYNTNYHSVTISDILPFKLSTNKVTTDFSSNESDSGTMRENNTHETNIRTSNYNEGVPAAASITTTNDASRMETKNFNFNKNEGTTNYNNIRDADSSGENYQDHVIYNIISETSSSNSLTTDGKSTNFHFENSGGSTIIDTTTHSIKDNENDVSETIYDSFSTTLNSFNVDESNVDNLIAETYSTNKNVNTEDYSTLFTITKKDSTTELDEKSDKDYISIFTENVFRDTSADNSLLSTLGTNSTETFLNENVAGMPFEHVSAMFNENIVEYIPADNNLLNVVGTNPIEVPSNQNDSDMSLEGIVFENHDREDTFITSNEQAFEKYIKEDNKDQDIEVTSKRFEGLVITTRVDRDEFAKTGNYFELVDKEHQLEYKTAIPIDDEIAINTDGKYLSKFDDENNEDTRLVTSGVIDTISIHDGIDKIKEDLNFSGTYDQTDFSENNLSSKGYESVATEVNYEKASDAIVTQESIHSSETASIGVSKYDLIHNNTKNNNFTDTVFQVPKGTTEFSINKISDGGTIDNNISTHSNEMNKQTQPIFETSSKRIEEITPNPASFETIAKLNNTKESTAEEFVCKSAGKFPDQKNRSLCHFCIDIFVKYVHVLMECSKSIQYDNEMTSNTEKQVESTASDVTMYCTTSGVFPHPTDCNRYYKCFWRSVHKNFVLWQFRCPPRMKYDAEKKLCVNATLLPHCGGLSEAPPDATESPFYCSENGRFPTEYNCDSYYECKEKKGAFQMKLKTCSEGKLFDREWGRCRRSDLVFCP